MALYRDPNAVLAKLAAGGPVDDIAPPPSTLAQATPDELRREGLQRRYDAQSESGRAFQQGIENLTASGQSARGLARILTGNETGGLADLQLAQRTQAEAAEFGPQVQSLEDIHDIGSGLAYARNLGLQQVPNIALAAASGGTGGLLRTGAGAAVRGLAERTLAREVAANIAERRGAQVVEKALVDRARRRIAAKLPERVLGEEFKHGAEAGAVAAGSVLQSSMAPEIVLDPKGEGSVKDRAAAAAVGAVATGALEALPVGALFRRYGLTGAEDAVRGSVLSRVTQQAAKQGLTEASTEVAQQVGERAAHKWVNDNVELMSPEAYSEYLNAAAGGFVGGGLFGAPAGLRGAGRDSEAGRSYVQALRGVTDRLKAGRERLRPSGAPAAPQAAPGSVVSESEPVELGEVVAKATRFAKDVSAQAGEVVKGIGAKLGEVGKRFNKTVEGLDDDTMVDHSVSDILDAEPYNFKTDTNGISTFNEAGAPFAQFADARRARRYVLAGDDGGRAAVKSTLPEARVDELTQSGAVGAALDALRGRLDKVDDAKLIQYEDALPEEARPMFHRAAATALQANKDGVQLAAREPGSTQAEPTADQKGAFVVDEEAPLRRAQESVKFVREASGGLLREGAQAPANHFVVTGQATGKDGTVKTVQRAISGQALGKLVQQVRKADSSLDTRGALATVVSDLQLGGLTVDPASLKAGLQLGKDWYLTPAMAATIAGDSAPTGASFATKNAPENFKLVAQPAKSPTSARMMTTEEERELNAELGRGDKVGVRGVEGQPKVAPTGPLIQRPGELRASPTGKLTEAQKIDAGVTDTAALREERKQFEPDAFNEIDQLLERHTGLTVDGVFDRRRDLYKQAIAKLPKGGAQRAELQAAAVRFGEAMATAQKNKVNAALKAWQANKSPKTKAGLDKARENYERTLESVTRSGTGELPSQNRTTPEMQELRQAQIDEDNVRAGSQQQPLSKEAKQAQIKAPRENAAKKETSSEHPAGTGADMARAMRAESKNHYVGKDSLKAKKATAFIGDGENGSSTHLYNVIAKRLGLLKKTFTSEDKVFVSANGARPGRAPVTVNGQLTPAFQALDTALDAGATIITDDKADRARGYNVGEKELADYLQSRGYAPDKVLGSTWTPGKAAKKLPATDKVVTNALGNEGFARWRNALTHQAAETYKPEFATRADPETMREQLDAVRSQIARDHKVGVISTGLFYEQAELEHMLGDDMMVDYSATARKEGIEKALRERTGTRSKQGLVALRQRVIDSTLSIDEKIKLVQQIDEQVESLDETTLRAGVRDWNTSSSLLVSHTYAHWLKARDLIDGDGDTRTVEDAIKAVRGMASDNQRVLMDALVKTGALKGVPLDIRVAINANFVSGLHFYNRSRAGWGDSRVELRFGLPDPKAAAMDPIQVLLHEAVHAATTWAELNDTNVARQLDAMLVHARREAIRMGVDPDALYGLSNTQEFLAEAFSNARVQGLLQQMPGLSKKTSLWEDFKALVAKLLGFGKKAPTALEEVLGFGMLMARETGRLRAQNTEALTGAELADYSASPMAQSPAAGSQPTDYMGMLPPDARRYLNAAFRRGDVFRQIAAAIPADQQLALQSADEGPRLLVNTGIALALQGRLNMKQDTKTFNGAINALWEVISKVLQVPSRTAYARAILSDLAAGTPAAKVDPQATLLKPAALQVTRFVQGSIAPKVSVFSRDIDARMRASGVPALTQLATLMSQRTGEFRADGSSSFVARRTAMRNKWLNDFYQLVGEWDDKKKAAVLKALQEANAGGFDVRESMIEDLTPEARRVRAFFERMRDYLKDAGLKFGETDGYFPVSMDSAKVAANKDAFIKLMGAKNFAATLKQRGLTPEKLYQAASAWSRETQVGSVTFADGDHDPTFRPLNKRLMDFVYKEGTPEQIAEFATFQDQDLDRVVVNYINRGVRRAEWTRLGLGKQIKTLLAQAKQQNATPAQISMARDYVDQVMGTYGTDWHPMIRKITERFGVDLPPFEKFERLNSALIAYQNLRLLPLAALSSLIDPLGVAVRTGEPAKAFGAYRDALRAMRNAHGNDALRGLAENMGIIERHAVSEALTYLFGGAGDPTGVAAKVNSALFRFNGLEYITKFSRLAALAAGNRFLITHAANIGDARSARYLRELGLTPEDIKVGPDGFVQRNDKIDAALTRFVDESVVRPTPTQRPQWHNDPHFALAAQYKGYLYSFWNTVVRRGAVELQNGNPRVLLPLLMYLPVTALGEMTRDMAQGDDDDRDARAYAALAVQRSGLLGPHINLLQNARQDLNLGHSILNSVAGPTGQQLGQMYDTANGQRSVDRTGVEALPASTLYEDWFQ